MQIVQATTTGGPVQWVGADPDSGSNECPAVAVIRETGDFLFRGKTVTDPAVITALNEHIGKAGDESDIWLPARMATLIREALVGYEQHRRGPGQHAFAELMAGARATAIRFETGRSDGMPSSSGKIMASDRQDHKRGGHDAVRAAVDRGVTVRVLQIVADRAPHDYSDRHAARGKGSAAGRADTRWLSCTGAADLLLPGADCWVFDYRVVRWDVRDNDERTCRFRYAFSSDPRIIRDIAAAFEIAWSRAARHEGNHPG